MIQRNTQDNAAREQAKASLRQSDLHLQVILEATADGILAVDNKGHVLKANRRFAELWRIPESLLERRDDQALLDFVMSQVCEPEAFRKKVEELYGSAETDLDKLAFKDGRVFERYSAPLLMDGAVIGRVWSFRDITELNRTEKALREREANLVKAQEIARLGSWTCGLSGPISWSDEMYRVYGVSPDTFTPTVESLVGLVHPDDQSAMRSWITACAAGEKPGELEFRAVRPDGMIHIVRGRGEMMYDGEGRPTHMAGTAQDVTERVHAQNERKKLEAQLAQSQKMESVGRLAGGVAHDFNNLLTAIKGYAQFVLDELSKDDPKREDVKEILAAGERAAGLTRQLLAFSRKQILDPQVLDINAVVGGTAKMLKRLIGEDIWLETRLAPERCLVKVDPGQIEQVILNLAVNARDAMPKGGTLTFATEIVTVDGDLSSRHPDIPSGLLVCLSVQDTGCGMSDEVKNHIFEPFFTTKEKGKGTGLGLATVFGIIKQSGGVIEVKSEADRGTIFRIYLQQMDSLESDQDKDQDKDKSIVPRGNETVLLVEDDDIVRRLAVRALTANGYAVLAAANGQEALEMLERHGRHVDLLVTDVVMPGLGGRELARAIAKKNLVRRTLFISGYTDDAIVQHGVLEPGLAFLYKPFSPDALLRKAREVLDGPADQARA